MAFTFGLGSDTMLNQFQRDAGQFKLMDISNNINKYTEAGNATGQAIQASYLDRTYSEFSRIMQKDQENDDAATFIFEYQALLRSRMQQMITELTAALTRDLDAAMNATRAAWDTELDPSDPTDPNPPPYLVNRHRATEAILRTPARRACLIIFLPDMLQAFVLLVQIHLVRQCLRHCLI